MIPKRISYEQFKIELEKYKNIEYKNEVISEIKNLFQEIIRLANFKLLDKGYWTKIYSSSTSYEEVKETGKLYVSIDNAYLYQFACLLFTNCLKMEFIIMNLKLTMIKKLIEQIIWLYTLQRII